MNSLANALVQFWKSSVGKKIIVALSGAMLVLFLLGHMAGNLLFFQGKEDLNEYAAFLHHMLHGWGIWGARIGILAAFLVHIVATISLVRLNKAARQSKYAYEEPNVASKSSRIMIWSGLTVLAFVVFHILHFTVRVDENLAGMKETVDGVERHDVYAMVSAGFKNPLVTIFYIIGVTLLCSHLSHGIASIFQTLGLRSKKSRGLTKSIGLAVSVVLWIGFLATPVSVLLGIKDKAKAAAVVKPEPVLVSEN